MKTILCTFFACALFCAVDVRAQQTPPSGAAFIAVCKESMTLAVYDFNSCLRAVYPIACGRALGNKEKPGDMKTPEGLFSVQQIQDASAWTHDFGDGKGEIRGAYGSHFIRLKTPGHRGIGIHGTHDPASIGTRATEGCVRLNNSDLLELVKKYVYVGMPVVILTSEADSAVPRRSPAAVVSGPWSTAESYSEISSVRGAPNSLRSGRRVVFQAGSRIEKRLPRPISLSTEIVPPCASTNSFEMASPSPLPCTLVPGTRK